MLGKLLHALIGYSERPTEMQLMAYIAALSLMFLLMRLTRDTLGERRTAASAFATQCGEGRIRRIVD